MGLEIQLKKLKLVIMGNSKERKRLIEELMEDPVKIQEFNVQLSDQETYLGFEFSSKGSRESVTQSIEKGAKMTSSIRLAFWLRENTCSRASILSYGAQTMTRKKNDRIRENLYRLFELSKFISQSWLYWSLHKIFLGFNSSLLKKIWMIHFITIEKNLDGFSARNFLDTDIDLPPHPDYVCLNSALLFSNFPSQFDICTASATCLVSGSPWWSSSWWLWMNELVSFFLNLCWCSPALVYRFLEVSPTLLATILIGQISIFQLKYNYQNENHKESTFNFCYGKSRFELKIDKIHLKVWKWKP